MKGIKLVMFVLAWLIATYGPTAEASSFLILVGTSSEAKFCNTSLPINFVNCSPAEGFVSALGSNTIFFSGSIGGFSISALSVMGNQPGVSAAGSVVASLTNVLHNSLAGNLQVDFGGNNFASPAGQGLFLSASDTGNWGQSQGSDQVAFTAWGRVDNALDIGGDGGPSVTAPNCIPGAGLTTSCAVATTDVPFTRGPVGNYALTGRMIINQSTSDTLGASYTATVAANGPTTTVPEPISVVMVGPGLLLLMTLFRRIGKG